MSKAPKFRHVDCCIWCIHFDNGHGDYRSTCTEYYDPRAEMGGAICAGYSEKEKEGEVESIDKQLSKLAKPPMPKWAKKCNRVIWSEEDEAWAEDADMYDEPFAHLDYDWDAPMWG